MRFLVIIFPLGQTGSDRRPLTRPPFLFTQVPKMNFCQDCNNMLYPRADPAERKLMMRCINRFCGYAVVADNPCVHTNLIKVRRARFIISCPERVALRIAVCPPSHTTKGITRHVLQLCNVCTSFNVSRSAAAVLYCASVVHAFVHAAPSPL